MCERLHTPAEAAEILRVPESWLRTKVTARVIPCTFIGKHLRFSEADIQQIKQDGTRDPARRRKRTG
jgi:excisionase family DNA binding protein